jgi:hypothetical protein
LVSISTNERETLVNVFFRLAAPPLPGHQRGPILDNGVPRGRAS